jgi:hypothetical protein
MGYKLLNSNASELLRWETPGQVVEGKLIGYRPGKRFGDRESRFAVLETRDGRQYRVPLPTALDGVLRDAGIEPGAGLRITYRGTRLGKNGREFKDFQVEVEEAQAVPQVSRSPEEEYRALADELTAMDGIEAAGAQLGALETFYPRLADRLQALQSLVARKRR